MDVVGRDDELSTIQAFLDGPVESTTTALVLEGEAGVGKSTLWSAGAEAARAHGFRVLSSRPGELERGVAHAALGDLLEEAFPDVASELPAPRRRALEVALLLCEPEDGPVDFRTVAVAVRTALEALAEREPVLVAIDDVQWLDASSESALAFALRRLPDSRIRLLLARRIGVGALTSALEQAVGDRVERVSVGSLSAGALQRLIQLQLGRVLARPTLLRLHEASGGNPFYALQIARALGADVGPTRPLPVPEDLDALVRARLHGLPEETRAALLLACVHGRLPPGRLAEAVLQPAYADGVIELDEGAVRFTHPLLSSALYQDATPAARRRAHAHVVDWVDDPLARARHQALAAEGPDAALASTLEETARTAVAHGAPIAAAELAELAVEATPADAPEDRDRRAFAAARAHLAAGEGARPRAIALDLVERASPGSARAEALVLLSETEGLQRGVGLMEEALVEAASQPALQVQLHQNLADDGRLIHGHRWAERHAREAVDLADGLDDDGLRAGALSTLALLRFGLGDPNAPGDAERAYRLALTSGDEEQRHQARWILGHVLRWSAETERARDLFEAQDRESRERNERRAEEAHWYLSLVELDAGRWDVAQRHAETARDVGEQYSRTTPQHMYPLGLVALHRGDLDGAREFALRGRDLADQETARLGGLAGIPGVVAAWSGDPAAALESFAEAEQHADASDWGEPRLRDWRGDYVEALLELGRIDEALAVLDDWESAAERVGRGWVLAHAARCRGLAAAARNEIDEAVRLLEEAVRAARGSRRPLRPGPGAAGSGSGQAAGAAEAAGSGGDRGGARRLRGSRRRRLGRESSSGAGPRRRPYTRGRSHAGRAPRRRPRGRRPNEPRGSRRPLPWRAHRREPPHAHLRQAGRSLTD